MSIDDNLAGKGPQKSSFADRLLSIFETIACHGPISTNNLMAKTGIPKVSVWRATQILKEKGWIRSRFSDGLFQVSPKFDDILADVAIPPPEVDEMPEILKFLDGTPPVAVAIGIFWSYGYYREIETYKANVEFGHKLSLVDDFQTTAALLLCSEAEVSRHLRNYARYCSSEERSVIDSGNRMQEILSQAQRGPFVWNYDTGQFAFPWLFRSGICGAVRVFNRDSKMVSIGSIEKAAATLAGRYKTMGRGICFWG